MSEVVCTGLSGKELHRQVDMGIVVTSGSLSGLMVSTLAWYAWDVGSIPALSTIFPILITPTRQSTEPLLPAECTSLQSTMNYYITPSSPSWCEHGCWGDRIITNNTLKWLLVGWLLEIYILATSQVIPGRAPTCDRVHSMRHYSAAPLGDQAVSNTTWYSTQSHYPDTKSTYPCPILIMASDWLWSDQYQCLSHWFNSIGNRTPDLPHAKPACYWFGHHARSQVITVYYSLLWTIY